MTDAAIERPTYGNWIASETRADRLAAQLVTSARPAGARVDAYFDTEAENLISLLLLAAACGDQPLTCVYSWLTSLDDDATDACQSVLDTSCPPPAPCVKSLPNPATCFPLPIVVVVKIVELLPSHPGRRVRERVRGAVFGLALVVAVVVVMVVVLGPRPAPNADAGSTSPETSRSASEGSVASTPSTASTPRSSPASKKPDRTARQQAAGVGADGSPLRVPIRGSGSFSLAERSLRTSATEGPLIRYDVAVERGLAINSDQAALLIASVLEDRRSWRGLGTGRFTLVRAGEQADLHAFIATPATTDKLCAPYRTLGQVSCQNGSKVVLNARRWVNGAAAYGDDTTRYRRYLVNHEFGHALGLGHANCSASGRPAPVMMQQTKGLKGCRANTWPVRTRG